MIGQCAFSLLMYVYAFPSLFILFPHNWFHEEITLISHADFLTVWIWTLCGNTYTFLSPFYFFYRNRARVFSDSGLLLGARILHTRYYVLPSGGTEGLDGSPLPMQAISHGH